MSIQELAETLRAINNGTIPADEARGILADINPVDLSMAEQRLIEEGTKPEELRRLCDVHLGLIQMEAEELKKKLQPGHPLHTMISEHDSILGFLDQLEGAADRIAKKDLITEDDPDLKAIREAASLLVETEKHHAREEDALFPEMEAEGITGPTRIMRLEHDELRAKKKALKALVTPQNSLSTAEARLAMMELASFIVSVLREHILKENSILYPSAFQALGDQAKWERIKGKCDQIGYCSFSPRH